MNRLFCLICVIGLGVSKQQRAILVELVFQSKDALFNRFAPLLGDAGVDGLLGHSGVVSLRGHVLNQSARSRPRNGCLIFFLLAGGHVTTVRMHLLLDRVDALHRQCASIRIRRSTETRHTDLKRALQRLRLPLHSILCRIRRGLVFGPRERYARHVMCAMLRFCEDVIALVRSLEDGLRCKPLMALHQACLDALSA